jgi:hypothetical protein
VLSFSLDHENIELRQRIRELDAQLETTPARRRRRRCRSDWPSVVIFVPLLPGPRYARRR